MSSYKIDSSITQARSSVSSSVNEGISEIKGADKLAEAINVFSTTKDSFANVDAKNLGNPTIATEAAVQPPEQYYRQASLSKSGLVNSNELQDKLNDPRLDIQHGLDGFLKNSEKAISEMSRLSNFELQSMMEKISNLKGMLSAIIKTSKDDENKFLNNLKSS